MSNKITNWSFDKPTEPGDYLVCYGDVETSNNVGFARLVLQQDGLLYERHCIGSNPVNSWLNSYKFARLDYEGQS